jgi:hypothetical protein
LTYYSSVAKVSKKGREVSAEALLTLPKDEAASPMPAKQR